jgi:hypothetical protein
MRGQNTQQAGMFSGLSPEEQVPVTHPLLAHPAVRGHGTDHVVAPVGEAVRPHGPALDCPGEAAARP